MSWSFVTLLQVINKNIFQELKMFGLGTGELVLIGIVAVLLFGPKKIPELAKSMGQGLRSFKSSLNKDETETEGTVKNNET
jgi:sec-independent protein translocase protein TatA